MGYTAARQTARCSLVFDWSGKTKEENVSGGTIMSDNKVGYLRKATREEIEKLGDNKTLKKIALLVCEICKCNESLYCSHGHTSSPLGSCSEVKGIAKQILALKTGGKPK